MASTSDENKVKDNTFIVSTDKVIKSKFVEITFWRNILNFMYDNIYHIYRKVASTTMRY